MAIQRGSEVEVKTRGFPREVQYPKLFTRDGAFSRWEGAVSESSSTDLLPVTLSGSSSYRLEFVSSTRNEGPFFDPVGLIYRVW